MTDKQDKPFRSRLSQLEQERNSFDPKYMDLRDHVAPDRGHFKGEKTNDGQRKDSKINNGTPLMAARTAAAGMNAGISSPARPWFRLSLPDEDLMQREDVRLYIHAVERKMYAILANSNFYNSAATFYKEILVFGTAVMLNFDHFDDVIHFYVPTVGEYYLGNDEQNRGRIIYRRFDRTARQLADEFGEENLSSNTARMLEKPETEDTWVSVIHAVEPNTDRDPELKDAKNKKYRSVYFEEGSSDGKLLRVSGFNKFPGTAARWDVVGSNIYGTGQPGELVLGDAKQLQKTAYDKQKGLAKNVDPPLQAPNDVKTVRNTPGGVSFTNPFTSSGGVRPLYETRVPIGEIIEDMNTTERRINQGFYVDLFLAIISSNRPSDMKAGVADQMDGERLLMLGPVLERLHHEWLEPTLADVFVKGEAAGIFPPAPEDLRDKELKFTFVSALAHAQKSVAIGGIERFTGLVGAWAQFDEEVVDKIDFDEGVDIVAELLGVSPTIVRSTEAADQVRGGRQAQQQQQQLLASAQAAASTAKDLSQAKVSEGNLLDQVTGI